MTKEIKIWIDGTEITTAKNKTILEAAKENNIYIPTLCYFVNTEPKANCRICTIMINNRMLTACTTPVADGMEIQNNTEELTDLRKSIIELLFVSGNHFCPTCEKSGNCELQALAYKYKMLAPRFPYEFPYKQIIGKGSRILKDQNRCIACKRCIKTIKDKKGRRYFATKYRGYKLEIVPDEDMIKTISEEVAQQAMDNCPVGSIIKKEVGFNMPIGTRKFDKIPIGK